ncbi:MAG: hypothetical protein ACR2GR_00890 [Rhodothermales bacterium]
MTRRRTPLLALSLCLLLATGCVSTQKRYEKATRLEAEARYAEAARYYAKVLKKEPAWEDAHLRPADVGGRAIDGFLTDAENAEHRGDYDEAVEALERIDDLRALAEEVGVDLPVPDRYADYRASVTEQAITDLLRRGERAERERRWAEALNAYERAAQRYAVPPAQEAALVRRRADVLLRWSRDELAAAHYRAAFDRAGQAADLFGPDVPETEAAYRLQEEALDRGTRYVAFLPVAVGEAAEAVPRNLLQDLDDVLRDARWDVSPFLVPLDAAPGRSPRRAPRRRTGAAPRPLTARQAAALGRDLGADFIVAVDLVHFERGETVENTWTRSARFRRQISDAEDGSSRDTTYTEQRLDVDLEAELAYRIIDPRTRRVLEKGTAEADVSAALRRGLFGGDWQRLDLSGDERDLFDPDVQRQREAEIEVDLVDRLAERLLDDLYEDVLDEIE